MATNEILPFSGTDTGTNLLTQAEYSADAQRPVGNQPGVARSKLVNKALKQASLISAAIGKFMADNQANDVKDDQTVTTIAGYFTTSITAMINAAIAALNLSGYARLNAAQSFTKAQSGAEVALPATTGTVTLDMSLANNFGGTLTGNIVLANPSSIAPGQSGVIRLVNGASPRTCAFGASWKFPGGAAPSLTATAGAVDLLAYYVESDLRITATIVKDIK